MKFTVFTIFPEMFQSFLMSPVIKRACDRGIAEIELADIKEYSGGCFRHIDDSPYGGGKGMIMRLPPILNAMKKHGTQSAHTVLLSPKGQKYDSKKARELSGREHIMLICGHYEGIDARIERYVDEEISLGDYVLTGGEIPAMAVMDSVIRFLNGVIRDGAADEESFENGLLEYPQYTRPRTVNGDTVPSVLLSGNQKEIDEWRLSQALIATKKYRPDMFERYSLSDTEKKLLDIFDTNGEHDI